MNWQELKEHLIMINKNYNDSVNKKDKQSLFYFEQMSLLMYNELCNEVSEQGLLQALTNNSFKKNIIIIYDNMAKYSKKVCDNAIKSFNELVKISASNRYVDLNNLNSLYSNFKQELMQNMGIRNKIDALVNANTDAYKGQIFSSCGVNSKENVNFIIDRYNSIFKEELIKNIHSKRDLLLNLYREFIDSILNDLYDQRDLVKNKNLKLIINTSYTYLKECEYINIDKYANANAKFIDESFYNIEKILYEKLGIRKNNISNLNPVKDYLLGFNNTIRVKTKNIFDEMNLIVTLDKDEINEKIKEFNDLITHVYEMKLIFDKQFMEYKKEFNLLSKDSDKFDDLFNKECQRLTEGIKTNISNIFRDNIKIYNDVVYKTLLLKSRVYEYNYVLTYDKVKDLLIK